MDFTDLLNPNFNVRKLRQDSSGKLYLSFRNVEVQVIPQQRQSENDTALVVLFRDALQFIGMIFPSHKEELHLPRGMAIEKNNFVFDLQNFLKAKKTRHWPGIEISCLRHFFNLKLVANSAELSKIASFWSYLEGIKDLDDNQEDESQVNANVNVNANNANALTQVSNTLTQLSNTMPVAANQVMNQTQQTREEVGRSSSQGSSAAAPSVAPPVPAPVPVLPTSEEPYTTLKQLSKILSKTSQHAVAVSTSSKGVLLPSMYKIPISSPDSSNYKEARRKAHKVIEVVLNDVLKLIKPSDLAGVRREAILVLSKQLNVTPFAASIDVNENLLKYRDNLKEAYAGAASKKDTDTMVRIMSIVHGIESIQKTRRSFFNASYTKVKRGEERIQYCGYRGGPGPPKVKFTRKRKRKIIEEGDEQQQQQEEGEGEGEHEYYVEEEEEDRGANGAEFGVLSGGGTVYSAGGQLR